MRAKRKVCAFAVTAALALSVPFLATGCSGGGSEGSGGDQAPSTEQTEQATEQTVTDDAGRENTIPGGDNLTSIYCTSPISELYLFTLAPEKAAGANSDYTDSQLQYLPDNVADLPSYGTMANGGTLNTEAIMAAGVQVILNVAQADITQSDIDNADALQEQTGIPVLLFNGSVEKTPDTYRSIGAVLGQADRAEEMASYLENVYTEVSEAVASIPEEERTTVYYAEGPDGLKTEPSSSNHFTTFLEAGAKNVADIDNSNGGATGGGMTQVSLENVIAWNPEVIIAWDDTERGGADDLIRTSSDWESIDAVANDRVYTIPCVPFMWGDRPPSVTRYIGMQWLANKLYPDVYDVDMIEETKNFYSLFFSVDLTDDEAKSILFLDEEA